MESFPLRSPRCALALFRAILEMLRTFPQQLFSSALPPLATESGLCSYQRLSAEGHLVGGYSGN